MGRRILAGLFLIGLGLLIAFTSSHSSSGGVLAGLVFGLLGFFYVVSALLSAGDEGPESSSGAPLSASEGPLGLDRPAAVAQVETPEKAEEKAARERLIESLREDPSLADEPYACLEMLLRKLPDGPEVQALVATARQGVAANLRYAVDDGQTGEIARQIAGTQNISPDLALWAVRTWQRALNHR